MLFIPITAKNKTKEMKSWIKTKFLYNVYRRREKPCNLMGHIIESNMGFTYFCACGLEQWILPWELMAIAKFIEDDIRQKLK